VLFRSNEGKFKVGNDGMLGSGGIVGILIGNAGIGRTGRVGIFSSKLKLGNEGKFRVGNDGRLGIGGIAGMLIGNEGIGIGGMQPIA